MGESGLASVSLFHPLKPGGRHASTLLTTHGFNAVLRTASRAGGAPGYRCRSACRLHSSRPCPSRRCRSPRHTLDTSGAQATTSGPASVIAGCPQDGFVHTDARAGPTSVGSASDAVGVGTIAGGIAAGVTGIATDDDRPHRLSCWWLVPASDQQPATSNQLRPEHQVLLDFPIGAAIHQPVQRPRPECQAHRAHLHAAPLSN
jgi:hypothetical protein